MITISKAASAGYYTSGGGDPGAYSYYLDAVDDGEPPGRWYGSGAAQLGLSGEVDAQDMATLYDHFIDPRTGEPVGRQPNRPAAFEERLAAALAQRPDALPEEREQIRRDLERTERKPVSGWDATFSVAKSVTVARTAAYRAELAALRAGDEVRAQRFGQVRQAIDEAIVDANAAMLAYLETTTTARTGGGSGTPTAWIGAPGIVSASFFQTTSRNVDPQLHVHNVLLNRAFCTDGKARALDGVDLLANRHAYGAIAARVMEEQLTAQGFEFALRPDGTVRELTVVDPAVCDLYSSRSRQVSAKAAQLADAATERLGRDLTDLELHYLKRTATLATRTAKTHDGGTVEEMLDRWEALCVSTVGASLESIADDIDAHLRARVGADLDADQRAAVEVAEWSPSAVIAEAVAAVGEQRATWRPADLTLEIARRLPSLGGLDAKSTIEVLQRLTDLALTGDGVRQVTGHLDPTDAHSISAAQSQRSPLTDLAAALEADPYTRPSARTYATTTTMAAEEALRLAAITRGRHAADVDAVGAWLDQHAPTIGADQRAAVLGIAGSDAALTVLVGPAGTGKSYAAGALAGAWHDVTGGRVVGLAVSQAATQVLADDGIDHARNIAQWLATQDRLADGTGHHTDRAWRLGPTDVVMVDEASMVSTADLTRIRTLVDSAGARLVLTGDPHQLGAVEAGGVMPLLDGHAETYTLTDVRRFANDWERPTSLALRDGQLDALVEYDRHGRLLAHDTSRDAITAAARAAVADRVDGRSVVVIAGTNAQAATIAGQVRDQLIDLGLVDPARAVLLGRDGGTASVGDIIAARRNDYALGVVNRLQYRVTAVGDDGSLTVQPLDRDEGQPTGQADERADGSGDVRTIHLPADYVAEDVQLGYASTVHSAQGLTVDAAHLVTDGSLDAAALYVGLTRGRLRNTAHVATTPDAPDHIPGPQADDQRPSARAVLEGCLERPNPRAATVEHEADLDRLGSLANLTGRIEAITRIACRERLDHQLDRLVEDGTLDEDTRARLCADQASDHLSRLLRAVEQAGHDPDQTLRDATGRRGLADAESVAQVLSHRITNGGRALPAPVLPTQRASATTATEATEATADDVHAAGDDAWNAAAPTAGASMVPAGISAEAAAHLEQLHARAGARRADLGVRTASDAPGWAVEALGPVPAARTPARQQWELRAGTIAGYREATGWTDDRRPIGAMPGVSTTERREAFAAAWDALGRPQTGLDEAQMSDGQLLARIRAAQAERAWAPPYADDALRASETAHEQARQSAVLAAAEADRAATLGQLEEAERLRAQAQEHATTADQHAAAIDPLTQAVAARAAWAAHTAVTLEYGERATREAAQRGLDIGHEPDRTTAEDWLTDQRTAIEAEDAHRPVTEADLDPRQDVLDVAQADEDVPTPTTDATDVFDDIPAEDDTTEDVPEDVPAPVETSEDVDQDVTNAGDVEPDVPAAEDTAQDVREDVDENLTDDVAEPDPSHAEVSDAPTAAELDLMLTAGSMALDQLAERDSADNAHTDPSAEETYSEDVDRRHREAIDVDTGITETGSPATDDSSSSDDAGAFDA